LLLIAIMLQPMQQLLQITLSMAAGAVACKPSLLLLLLLASATGSIDDLIM
jgi:hypothetical protein